VSLVLYGYWRSGAAYRTRIGLNLKGVAYEQVPLDLRTAAHRAEAFVERNPQGLVPALEVDGATLTQSLAILEWLDEAHPEPPLLPRDPIARARVRAMAAIVACDIHPLNNLRVLQALKADFGADEGQTKAWIARWIHSGFAALDALVARHGQGFAFGATPTLADCLLVPQIYSAERFGVDLTPFPHVVLAGHNAAAHPAFAAAHPSRQPDADQP
jgi:maleylpyruvate isomerase